ncbi:Aste57867_15527 [Aphanomyces stellatus]|uniref:Aste57867_15527 protein n=1 Tax=Aphanomyces stellatus TaxID=120398 RepID=A0A485L3L3_9STRA|nr:hypothetical protein As57867_015471 [Aphanomyces stellatus]VFT92329.1 Aste57867_15527 [Aphanomyces stellatus]
MEAPPSVTFDAPVEKGEHGFGIYFTRTESSHVIVEGFVPCADGSIGPAEVLGTIEIDDVLERINGLDVTEMEMPDIINELRAAAKGPNVLTFRRRSRMPSTAAPTTDKSPFWCTEFHQLQAAESTKWSASILSEVEFCDYLYREADSQQKSYLRQQYPTLMAHHQAQFEAWPVAVMRCEPAAYERLPPHHYAAVIAPSACLVVLLESLRVRFTWTRDEMQALMVVLQAQHGIMSALDLVLALGRWGDDDVCVLHHAHDGRQSYPRLTKAMWVFLYESAIHALSADELAYVNERI